MRRAINGCLDGSRGDKPSQTSFFSELTPKKLPIDSYFVLHRRCCCRLVLAREERTTTTSCELHTAEEGDHDKKQLMISFTRAVIPQNSLQSHAKFLKSLLLSLRKQKRKKIRSVEAARCCRVERVSLSESCLRAQSTDYRSEDPVKVQVN
jgi:hypothetical protein